MAAIKAKINNQQDLRVRSAIVANEVSKLRDVDLTNLQDGSLLIYSSSSSKWEASTLLEKQVVEGGQY